MNCNSGPLPEDSACARARRGQCAAEGKDRFLGLSVQIAGPRKAGSTHRGVVSGGGRQAAVDGRPNGVRIIWQRSAVGRYALQQRLQDIVPVTEQRMWRGREGSEGSVSRKRPLMRPATHAPDVVLPVRLIRLRLQATPKLHLRRGSSLQQCDGEVEQQWQVGAVLRSSFATSQPRDARPALAVRTGAAGGQARGRGARLWLVDGPKGILGSTNLSSSKRTGHIQADDWSRTRGGTTSEMQE